jgi:prophage regulatory protein
MYNALNGLVIVPAAACYTNDMRSRSDNYNNINLKYFPILTTILVVNIRFKRSENTLWLFKALYSLLETDDNMINRIMRRPEVQAATGLSRTTIYRLMSERSFPRQVKLTATSVGWLENEIEDWIESRTH